MADTGLFIGWGAPVRGREKKGLDVFNEAVQWYGQVQQDGRIESFEVALLEPHGGDLEGFFVVRGEQEELNRIRTGDEFQRLAVKAQVLVQAFGVVGAVTGERLNKHMAWFAEAAKQADA